jgi:hypothetical protein
MLHLEHKYNVLNAIRAADARHLWLEPLTASQRRAIPEHERLPKPIAVTVLHSADDTQPDEPEYEERRKAGFPGWWTVTAFRPGKKDKHKYLHAEISGFDDEAGIADALLTCGVEDGTPVFIWRDADHGWSYAGEPELISLMLAQRSRLTRSLPEAVAAE